LLADEPTGNLDTQMANSVLDLLKSINAAGTTIIMVTHDGHLAKQARRNIYVRDGKVSEINDVDVAMPTQLAAV
jgi:putative ABC transport system ATP-binding protein